MVASSDFVEVITQVKRFSSTSYMSVKHSDRSGWDAIIMRTCLFGGLLSVNFNPI